MALQTCPICKNDTLIYNKDTRIAFCCLSSCNFEQEINVEKTPEEKERIRKEKIAFLEKMIKINSRK
jgi:hypothetical protein